MRNLPERTRVRTESVKQASPLRYIARRLSILRHALDVSQLSVQSWYQHRDSVGRRLAFGELHVRCIRPLTYSAYSGQGLNSPKIRYTFETAIENFD
jgi:hypothetical protein